MRDEETSALAVAINEVDFAKRCNLEIIYNPDKGINLYIESINRPGLMLSGFGDYFDEKRIQVFGKNEISYLNSLDDTTRYQRLKGLFERGIPCLILSRNQKPLKEISELAVIYKTPLYISDKITSDLINDLSRILSDILAPTGTVHGVLLDVYGTGVLITGKSGIGKSETALELIHRGHRLVSDDVVEVKGVKYALLGSSPPITQNMMELRGVGIIDVKAVFGVGAVVKKRSVQIIVELAHWDNKMEYNRAGNVLHTQTILGIKIPKYVLPVVQGRNIAVLIEASVRDFRLKQEGYNTLSEINSRMSK